jgi:hypothetical protein
VFGDEITSMAFRTFADLHLPAFEEVSHISTHFRIVGTHPENNVEVLVSSSLKRIATVWAKMFGDLNLFWFELAAFKRDGFVFFLKLKHELRRAVLWDNDVDTILCSRESDIEKTSFF